MKTKYFILVAVTILFCMKGITDCQASIDRYNINTYNTITVRKGSRTRLELGSKKLKWNVSDKSIATINKKGILKAKKCGKVKIRAKTAKGKKYTVKITVKKKLNKATKKNISMKIKSVERDTVYFQVKNDSDECIALVQPVLQYGDHGDWQNEEQKESVNRAWSHIIILPGKTYEGYFYVSNYEMSNSFYRIIFTKAYRGSMLTKRELNFQVNAEFEL